MHPSTSRNRGSPWPPLPTTATSRPRTRGRATPPRALGMGGPDSPARPRRPPGGPRSRRAAGAGGAARVAGAGSIDRGRRRDLGAGRDRLARASSSRSSSGSRRHVPLPVSLLVGAAACLVARRRHRLVGRQACARDDVRGHAAPAARRRRNAEDEADRRRRRQADDATKVKDATAMKAHALGYCTSASRQVERRLERRRTRLFDSPRTRRTPLRADGDEGAAASPRRSVRDSSRCTSRGGVQTPRPALPRTVLRASASSYAEPRRGLRWAQLVGLVGTAVRIGTSPQAPRLLARIPAAREAAKRALTDVSR